MSAKISAAFSDWEVAPEVTGSMVKSDLHPPQSGPGSDPVLYGVAAGLAALFPLDTGHVRIPHDREPVDTDESDRDPSG